MCLYFNKTLLKSMCGGGVTKKPIRLANLVDSGILYQGSRKEAEFPASLLNVGA